MTATGTPSVYSSGLINRPWLTPIFLMLNHSDDTVEQSTDRGLAYSDSTFSPDSLCVAQSTSGLSEAATAGTSIS